MFTTVERVKQITGYDVTIEQIGMSQEIIESFIGRTEAEVDSPNDRALLGKAVAYQAAYMSKNYETIFEQVALSTVGQQDGAMVLDLGLAAPYIAPLAIFTMRGLSWKKSRSVRLAPMFGKATKNLGWERS